MKRPSRRLRESATTTLKNGRFLAPPRASRMTTMARNPVFRKKDVDYTTENSLKTSASAPRKASAEWVGRYLARGKASPGYRIGRESTFPLLYRAASSRARDRAFQGLPAGDCSALHA